MVHSGWGKAKIAHLNVEKDNPQDKVTHLIQIGVSHNVNKEDDYSKPFTIFIACEHNEVALCPTNSI